jgi:phospholipid transport system substrate-binding protein
MNPGRRLFVSAATMALTVPIALAAWAAPTPTEQVRASIQRVLRILDDSELRGELRQAERRAAIRKVAHELFDFAEITKRSIGHHWQQRTAAEREELVSLFGDLLERTYVSRIEVYSGEKIAYVGESVETDQAVVRTRIVTKQGTEIPVDYRMVARGSRWQAYDVTIEGVSLVANYRSQFNKILQTGNYPELIKRLRIKLEERTDPTDVKARAANN